MCCTGILFKLEIPELKVIDLYSSRQVQIQFLARLGGKAGVGYGDQVVWDLHLEFSVDRL